MRHGIDTSFLVALELAEHPKHLASRTLLAKLMENGDRFALAPQVLAEFIHVAADDRRFERPLGLEEARNLAEQWWTAREVDATFPDRAAIKQYFEWLQVHRLGRKRQLDTLLAATYLAAGTTSILTLNIGDFVVFGCFHSLGGVEDVQA